MEQKSTAERIAVVAGKLVDREGADALTMRRVAKSLGVTPMALYRHYPDRDGLLTALVDAGFDELALHLTNTAMPDHAEQRLMRILDVFLDFALQKPRLFELMFLRQRAGARQFPEDFQAGRSPTAKVVAEALDAGMKRGVFRKDDVWELAFEMGAMLQGLVMLYVGGRVGTSAGEFRALCRRAFRRHLHGIRS